MRTRSRASSPIAPGSAHRRAVDSFFADSRLAPGAVRVCRGLSCALNGGGELGARVSLCAPVYCLGYCDRAPALLLADGEVRCGADALAWPRRIAGGPSPVDIRVVASRAIVTERIVRGSHADLGAAREAGVYATLDRALAAHCGVHRPGRRRKAP